MDTSKQHTVKTFSNTDTMLNTFNSQNNKPVFLLLYVFNKLWYGFKINIFIKYSSLKIYLLQIFNHSSRLYSFIVLVVLK